MNQEEKALFEFPVMVTGAEPKGTIIMCPLPTTGDMIKHGSFQKYVEARKKEFAMLTSLDDVIFNSDVIE